MKLETDYRDVQMLLEAIKEKAESISSFVDESVKTGTLDKEAMGKEVKRVLFITTAFEALHLHFKMKENENGTKIN